MRHAFTKYAAVATLVAGIGFAQAPAGNLRPDAEGTQEGRRGFMSGHLDRFTQALNLTDSQKEQARKIFDSARQSAQPIRQEMRQNREKLAAAAKVSTNESDIQKLATEQGRLFAKLVVIRTEASAKFYKILTPEQRMKADQMHEQMREQFKRRVRPETTTPPEREE